MSITIFISFLMRSNTTFQNFPGVSDLLPGASKFQHHTELRSKRRISLLSSSNLRPICLLKKRFFFFFLLNAAFAMAWQKLHLARRRRRMWCWRRMEKISWTDHVRNEVLIRVNEQSNILHEIRKRKANLICHILRRNCLLQRVIEGKIKVQIEVTGRRGRRRKKLLDDLNLLAPELVFFF